jgi:hypothetical protein
MQDPDFVSDANGEYFEVYNASGAPIDMEGWTLRSAGNSDHVINNGGSLIVGDGEYLVFGRNANSAENGGVPVDYEYTFGLNNTTDNIVILDGGLIIIDSVAYDGGVTFPDPTGASMIFTGAVTDDNNIGSDWVAATLREPNFTGLGTDFGSPGTGPFMDDPLPVELMSFRAIGSDNRVVLKWVTASELDNLGFEIFKSEKKNTDFKKIASYLNSPELKGAGSTSTAKSYSFADTDVINNTTYWYKLVDVSNDGIISEHGPVSVTPVSASIDIKETIQTPDNFILHQNFPNPFNPNTTIKLEVPQSESGSVEVVLAIYNISGQKIKTLFKGILEQGIYTYRWDGTDSFGKKVASGMYIYQLESNEYIYSNRMLFLQ